MRRYCRKLAVLVLAGLSLLTTNTNLHAESAYFRLLAPSNTTIVRIYPGGTLVWSNSSISITATVQVATDSVTNWQDYAVDVVGNTFQTNPIVDLNPPSGMSMIPGGSVVMGATTNMGHESYAGEIPQHSVHVSAYYLEQHLVTKALWNEVANWASTNGYDITASNGLGKSTNHPVQMVTWYECVKWCNARSQMNGLTPCYTSSGIPYTTGSDSNVVCNWSANGFRLPTEAEWEKAARGGLANHRFSWGDSENIQHARGNYNSNASLAYDTSPTSGFHPTFNDGIPPYTSPVGYFAANGFGLYDMTGNVWAWCWDWYDASYFTTSPTSDPRGASIGTYRTMRGGNWYDWAHAARVAFRGYDFPTYESDKNGFRCARSL